MSVSAVECAGKLCYSRDLATREDAHPAGCILDFAVLE
jgi:hypothetical protein